MHNRFKSYYKDCFWEQLDFKYRLYLLSKEKNLSKAALVAQSLMYKAVQVGLGYFASSELEKPFLKLAKEIETPSEIKFKKGSFLHVMTEAYAIGGHTRVVERWIDSSNIEEKHSLIVLSQEHEELPNALTQIVQKHNGNVILLSRKELLERAKILRMISLEYEYIILHIHMWDPTAIVAYGTNAFTRPVILFNHADHLYWCGSSIVDMLADLRDNDFYKVRGIKNHFTLRIPFEKNELITNYKYLKEESRARLGLPLDTKIILTVGGRHKYYPIANIEFCTLINEAIKDYDNVLCIGIGPTKDVGSWACFGEKFMALGEIDYGSKYFDYLNACDLYIDSITMGGGTAMLDAIQFKKPVLSYSVFDTKLGNIIKGINTIYNKRIFINTIKQFLSAEIDIEKYANMQNDDVIAYHGINSWKNNLKRMIRETPNQHSINERYIKGKKRIDDLSVMTSILFKTSKRRSFTKYDLWHQIKCLFYKG